MLPPTLFTTRSVPAPAFFSSTFYPDPSKQHHTTRFLPQQLIFSIILSISQKQILRTEVRPVEILRQMKTLFSKDGRKKGKEKRFDRCRGNCKTSVVRQVSYMTVFTVHCVLFSPHGNGKKKNAVKIAEMGQEREEREVQNTAKREPLENSFRIWTRSFPQILRKKKTPFS